MRRTIAVSLAILVSVIPQLPAMQGVSPVMQPTVPSPTAASLGKFGDVPISYATGIPQISIPLFTVKGKTLDLPISLSYHASGIKVEEIGSWVGAGWALEAGGAITRTVRGLVDEQTSGYFTTGWSFYVPANWVNPPPATLVRNIHDDHTVDPEPDQFFFNFAGQAGEIVGGPLTSNSSDPNVFVAIPFRKWRIVPDIGTDPFTGYTIIKSWAITTEDGTTYTFAAPEVHIDRSWTWLSGYHDSNPYASAWYLTKIRAVGRDSITLQYSDSNSEHHTGMYREQANNISEPVPGDCSLPGYLNPNESNSRILDLHSQTYAYTKTLVSITAAAHTITFSHSLRDDARSPYYGINISGRLQQEPKLDLITVATPAGVVLRKFEFEYTYGGPLGGRLTLLNVYEEDASGTRLPPYSFTYSGPTLPPRVTDKNDYHDPSRTASFALDYGGFYNGATSNTTLTPPGTADNGTAYPGADRDPSGSATAGSLIKITYPTGGTSEFVYGLNEYSFGGPMPPGETVWLNPSVVSSPGEPSPHYVDFTPGGQNATINATLDVYMSSEACSPAPCIAELWQGTTRLSAWTGNRSTLPWTLTRGVTYTLKAWNQGTPGIRVSITFHWSEQLPPPLKRAGPGLRIAQIRTDDGMGNVSVRQFQYDLSDGRSSGWIAAEPRFDYDRHPPPGLSGCTYYSRSSAPKNVLGSGPLITYSVVTEVLGVNGVFGTTQRTFRAGCDCAAASQAGNYHRDWPSLRYTTDAWRRGEELSAADYSAAGAIQRSVTSTYGAPPSPYPLIEFRGLAVDIYSMWPGAQGVVYANQFLVRSGLKVQTDQLTTVYDTTGTSSFATNKHFAYGNVNHAQLTEITETNSDGTQRITRMRYPGDYTTGGPGAEAAALTAMQSVLVGGAHMPGVVIERIVSVKNGASERIVQGEITTFKEFLTGQFLPFKHYVFNSPSPIP